MKFRIATPQDIPQLKHLWYLAFHDQGSYVDHFFRRYCSPTAQLHTMLVAEIQGEVVAMTAYFASTLHHQGDSYPLAYLYAVATHPTREKQGIASALLRFVYDHVKELGFTAVSTVPAQPSLHQFFGRNGFSECFLQSVLTHHSPPPPPAKPLTVVSLSAPEYQKRRAKYLQGITWVDYALPGQEYQEGICALGRGGLFATDHSLCTLEEGEEGHFVAKELLGSPDILWQLWQDIQPTSLEQRSPVFPDQNLTTGKLQEFGMIQWLDSPPDTWTDQLRGFLGMGFD